MSNTQIEKYESIIRALAADLREIGKGVVAASGSISHAQKLNPYDLLTEQDGAVEDHITRCLHELDPETPVVGEERGGDRTAERYWLIDPIDGTIHFVRGNPFYCSMLALVVDGESIVSIIYNFVTQELFHAIKGHGAYCNGIAIKTSTRTTKEAIVQTEIILKNDTNLQIHNRLSNKFRLMSLFAPGYEYAMIASGRAEARVCIDPAGKDYDFAPGTLLVQEAGGVAKNLLRENFRTSDRDFITASSPEVYEDLLSVVTDRTMQ